MEPTQSLGYGSVFKFAVISMSLMNGVYNLEGALAGGEDTAGAAASVGLEAGEAGEAGKAEEAGEGLGEAVAAEASAMGLSDSKSRVLGVVSGNV